MIKIIKLLGKICLGLLGIVLTIVWGYFFYQQVRLTDTKIEAKYGEYFEDVEIKRMIVDGREMRYLDIGTPGDQLIMMIHGAPGSLYEEHKILSDPRLHVGYRFIIIDRLGYGKSGPGKSVESIKTHSDIYVKLLDTLENIGEKKPLVVGHSYGATITMKMLMDRSDKLSGGVVVSGALDPDLEKVFSISHLIKYQPFKFLSGPMFRVANDEKLAHVQSLTNEVQNYEDINKHVHIIHGTEDSIVPYGNLEYMSKRVPSEYLQTTSLTGADHALHMTDPTVFGDAITSFIFDGN